MPLNNILNRRNFLKSVGWSTAGLTVFVTGCSALPVLPHRKEPSFEDAALWLSLRDSGSVEVVCPRIEIGQGITIAIKQIVAEELDLSAGQVSLIMQRSDRLMPTKATVGSDSIKEFGPLVAKAAAGLAAIIKKRAAGILNVAPGAVTLTDGVAVAPAGNAVPFARLTTPPLVLNESDIEQAVPVSFNPEIAKKVIGRPLPPHQLLDIVTAQNPVFADDLKFPDMLHARLLHPAALSADFKGIDDSAARSIPGFHDIVIEDDLIAIIARSRGSLDLIEDSIAVHWDIKEVAATAIEDAIDIDRGLSSGALEHVELEDEFNEDEQFDIDLKLSVPVAAHGAMEPRTALARTSNNADGELMLEIWTGSQDITLAHKFVSQQISLPPERIIIHAMRVGGGFGGKTFSSIETDVARLAMILRKPVKLQWTREHEFNAGFHRPPSSHRIRARLNEAGELDGWWHAFRSGHVIFSSAFLSPLLQSLTGFIGDAGVLRGAIPPYKSARNRVEFEDVRIPVMTGPWRGLGAAPNCWAIETAIDALARQKGLDPLNLRITLLSNHEPRLTAVLKKVAQMADWKHRKPTENSAFGLACGIYKDMSYSATICEIHRRAEGGYRIAKFWSVQDSGFIVNPDQVKAQIEGNLVWGIGMAFYEGLNVEDNRLSADNFDSYTWAAYSDVPEMDIKLIENDTAPAGAGETAITSATAAITNAVAALSGKTVTSLPVSA